MNTPTPPDVVRLRGTAHDRGRQQAERRPALRDAVRAAVTQRLADVAPLRTRAPLRDYLARQADFLRTHDPIGHGELLGLAEGWGLPADDLLAYLHANVLIGLADAADRRSPAGDATADASMDASMDVSTDASKDMSTAAPADPPDGCTAWAMVDEAGAARVVKNRDYRGEHGALQQVFLHEADEASAPGSPEATAGVRRVLCVGSLGSPGAFSSGMNDHGLAIVDTQIGSRDHGVGWLRYFLITALLWRCADVPQALALLRAATHAGGGTLVLGDARGGLAAVELSHTHGAVVETSPAWVARTNHHLHEALAQHQILARGDPGDSSTGRLDQVRARLQGAAVPLDRSAARALMSSHGQPPLCRHALGAEGSRTLSCVVYDTGARTLRMSHGNPCEAPWASYRLHDAGVDACVELD
jgi:isopenicillin-N N-acyltransferase-like protein